MGIAAKIAEEVFLTIERNQRIVKGDIVEAVTRVLALEQRKIGEIVGEAVGTFEGFRFVEMDPNECERIAAEWFAPV